MPTERKGSQLGREENKSGTSEMDDSILRRLLALANAGREWVNRDLYRLMYSPRLYVDAYERIKSKPGNMTPGPDGSTLDGFSMRSIEEIAARMRDESFQFSRARRVQIPKPSGGKRPLGIAPPRDKVVQEAMRTILEAIYNSPLGSTFSENSHGFRPGRGPHTAIRAIRTRWSGVCWVIEGDIKGCFDNIDHSRLIDVLRKRISDERFLNLVRKSLTAGYLEFRTPVNSIIGTPQGSILSPLLANIYMHELDLFVDGIAKREERPPQRVYTKEYADLTNRIRRLRRRLTRAEADAKEAIMEELEATKKAMRTTRPFVANSAGIQVRYVRYADDWVIGINGPKELAVRIREEVGDFFSSQLKLTLSLEKTHIRHAKTEEAFFLGTCLTIGHDDDRVTTIRRKGSPITKRTGGWTPKLMAPVDRIVRRLNERGICGHTGNPVAVATWMTMDDEQIIEAYNSVLWGYLNFYSFAANIARLGRVQYIIQHSAAKTLAGKHKSSRPKMFRKHGRNLTIRRELPDGSIRTWALKLRTDWRANQFAFMVGDRAETVDGIIHLYRAVQFQATGRSKTRPLRRSAANVIGQRKPKPHKPLQPIRPLDSRWLEPAAYGVEVA